MKTLLLRLKGFASESASIWPLASIITASAFSFLNAIILSRLFSPHDYGIYRYVIAWVILSSFFTVSGSLLPLTQAVQDGKEMTFFKVIKMRMMYGLIGFLFFTSIAAYYYMQGNEQLAVLFMLYAPFVVISETLTSYASYLQGKGMLRFNFFIDLLTALFGTVLVVGVVLATGNIIFAFLANITALFVCRFFASLYVSRRIKKLSEAEDVTKYSMKLTFTGSFEILAQSLDKTIVFQILGAASLSSYIFAILFVDQIREMLRVLIWKYILLDTHREKKIPLVRILLYACTLIVLYALFAPLLYRIFFPEYDSVALISIMYSFSLLSAVIFVPLYEYQAKRRTRQIGAYNALLLLSIIIAVSVGGSFYGVSGAVLGLLFARVFSSGLLLFFFKKGLE